MLRLAINGYIKTPGDEVVIGDHQCLDPDDIDTIWRRE